ncbi:cytochrome P450 [Thermomonospora cellulosilytica]|uniref:Cholest-4-en-3-one 26-monooxygenase n=1 Tax=Thermomonospora cellulosilytica TaxID=1411118 RepID=A0A7W3N4L7_9ACTN|nr:cytochrome P450 [Thermomonospora cellulosilytica]MBA9007422.1 cholest-4-en-3-one 26-monooxygenase [Thermomonospora cellulosilytica]
MAPLLGAPEINLVDPAVYERDGVPHEQLAWLREHEPVFRHDGDPERGWPAFWAVTRHADVVHVSRHPELFSSYRRLALFDEMDEERVAQNRLMMLNQDPPEHTRRRGIVNRGFTPRAIEALTGHVLEICRELAAGVLERGPEADFVRDLAAPLPLQVICELLGAPVEDRDKIFHWSNTLIGADDPDFREGAGSDPRRAVEAGNEAAMALYAYANELAARRRAEPRDDIVTRLLRPGPDGQVLDGDEFELFVLLLSVAGNETTRNAASGGMLALLEHPGQWERLKADPALVRTAADEIVRWVTPVNLFRRTAVRDTELGGRRIREGDKVVVFYASANRDERVFTDPFAFDVGRDPNPHVGFGGGGPHYCLGVHLARLELRALLQTLLDTMPNMELTGNVRRLRSYFINGVKEMPVRVAPRS